MTDAYSPNTKVAWDWGQGAAEGRVQEVYREKVTKNIKGTEVTRNASDEEPAYLIEQDDGDRVLKSHSEVRTCS